MPTDIEYNRHFFHRLGIGNLLEVMHEKELESMEDDENAANDNEDYDKKSDTAEDFSDITELAEDLQTVMQVITVIMKNLNRLKLFSNLLKLQ